MNVCTDSGGQRHNNPAYEEDNQYSTIGDGHYEDMKPKEAEHEYSKPDLD